MASLTRLRPFLFALSLALTGLVAPQWTLALSYEFSTFVRETGNARGFHSFTPLREFYKVDAAGNSYILSFTNDRLHGMQLVKVSADGARLIYSMRGDSKTTHRPYAFTVDSAGSAYVIGYTEGNAFTSHSFPDTRYFLLKLDSEGNTVYSFRVGAVPKNVAVDAEGHVYIVGVADCGSRLPGVEGASQSACGGKKDAVVMKYGLLNGRRHLFGATYLGGADEDEALDLALDGSGNVYLTGRTNSRDFPTTPGVVQSNWIGLPDCVAYWSCYNGFAAKLTPDLKQAVYSTYIGGSTMDEGLDIEVDGEGNAHVLGETASTDFPTNQRSYLSNYGGGQQDVFLVKLNPHATAFVYTTYLYTAPRAGELAKQLALTSSGHVLAAWWTGSDPHTPLVRFDLAGDRVSEVRSPGPLWGIAVGDQDSLYLNFDNGLGGGESLHYNPPSVTTGGAYQIDSRSDPYLVAKLVPDGSDQIAPLATLPVPSDILVKWISRTEAEVSWTPSGSEPVGYEISRTRTTKLPDQDLYIPTDYEQFTVEPEITLFRDETVKPGERYVYRVRAVKGKQVSHWSYEAGISMTLTRVPSPPATRLYVDDHRTESAIYLRWEDVANEQGYWIERRNPDGSFSRISGNIPINHTRFADRNLQPNTSHTYRIFAFNESGVSPPSDPVTVKLTDPPCLKGDATLDGAMDITDAVAVLGHVVRLKLLSSLCSHRAADVDCNGRIDVLDAVSILRKLVGLPVPACP